MRESHWLECPDCGLLQVLPPPRPKHVRNCPRCRRSFGDGANHGDAARALTLTALLLFALANLYPFMGLEFGGRENSIHLGSGIGGMASHEDLMPIALMMLAISILAPLGRLAALGLVLLQLRRGRNTPLVANLMHFADRVRGWAMLDVFLVGSLVALTKLHNLARVTVGIGLYMLGALVLVLAFLELAIDRHAIWHQIRPSPSADTPPRPDWLGCVDCGMVQEPGGHCVRCGTTLHRRKPRSIERTAALVLTGFILYLPANLYPVLTVITLGRGAPSTILGGVAELVRGNDWPLAVIVFVASVAVPLLKLFGLGLLILSARRGSDLALTDRTRLYRLIELVGRWSTVDVIVAALLTALVTLGNIAEVLPGLGVLAFGGVVFVTLLATEFFDPRLLWDAAGENHA
ncbi:MAG TPA: PqiA/YebS family transporter subunit [Magnetospirillaceae bacterium]|nr:PqiA/YebS family transporter subunit [Magnetospirillaceae bacterium]